MTMYLRYVVDMIVLGILWYASVWLVAIMAALMRVRPSQRTMMIVACFVLPAMYIALRSDFFSIKLAW